MISMPSWPQDKPSSLWMRLSRERFNAPELTGNLSADAVVVGGGISGLSTALALKERGLDVVVLEAVTIGSGASGRANGQVIATLTQHSPDAVSEQLGKSFLHMVTGSADKLYGFVERFGIDCDAARNGWLQPAHSPGRARRAQTLAQQWARAGAPAVAVDKSEVSVKIGAPGYYGGWLHAGGGHINPYAFTLGLARGAGAEGVSIFEHSPALSLSRADGMWQVTTPGGEIRARFVGVATGAHTGSLWPGLERTFVPVTSYQTATEPLGALAEQILPGDHAFSDTRRDLRYMRKDREGRLISGAALAIQAGAPWRLPPMVRNRLGQLFPTLSAVAMPDFWAGRIAMTADRLPHLHRTDDGLAAWVGCNGRGLALCCAMGSVLADAMLGRPAGELALRPTAIKQLPFHGFIVPTARMVLPYYRWLDRQEAA
jgi:glycine/D-amino acid oxidase-like deaminating enzyme